MAKPPKSQFVCQSCGAVSQRWAGKCAACGEWNSIAEEANPVAAPGSGLSKSSKGRGVTLESLHGGASEAQRIVTGNGELDLTGVRLLSEAHYLWSPGSLAGNLTSFFASKAVRGRSVPHPRLCAGTR